MHIQLHLCGRYPSSARSDHWRSRLSGPVPFRCKRSTQKDSRDFTPYVYLEDLGAFVTEQLGINTSLC
jgi:hypothetical protein